MVDRTTWSIKVLHKKNVDLLHIRYMELIKGKITLTDFLGRLIKMGNDMMDLLQDPEMGPLIKAFMERAD